MVNKQNLINWLNDQIYMEYTCIDDMEITEGEDFVWVEVKLQFGSSY